jgi:hypothetical protein
MVGVVCSLSAGRSSSSHMTSMMNNCLHSLRWPLVNLSLQWKQSPLARRSAISAGDRSSVIGLLTSVINDDDATLVTSTSVAEAGGGLAEKHVYERVRVGEAIRGASRISYARARMTAR